ncbi:MULTISPECIES: hypothetical protein [Alphaproteobacteria]|uniref:Uncharacterized protein n=2 Tax=Alphaproteobacteria TaxID=28211 RepID=A0A512HN45_9HYPH|nr:MULTISPECIES: hypothetical protein [Alphaproteobacteria]GEO86874.1 hypothetical protein RNA01_38060 [Ciceribacter naphthalenivorans]GLR24018.1 hypothetical protein GCM10007920_38120 [Ciceribacter naphthalenivorans]GLT06874.1 hypothetical protein GCM10007926_38120 [Sphingomonas psychrolutea]
MNQIMACYTRFDEHGPLPWNRLPKGPGRPLRFALHRLGFVVFLTFGGVLVATVVLLMLASWLLGVDRDQDVSREQE